MRARWLVAAVAALAVGGSGVAVLASADQTTAACTPSPQVTYSGSDATIALTCSVPLPAPVTVTQTSTATVTGEPSPSTASDTTTASSTATSSTTSTSTSTATATATATPEPTPVGDKPTDANTGIPAGTTLKPYTGSLSIAKDNLVLDGYDFPGFLKVTGTNVTIRNSRLRGLAFYGPGPLLLQDSTGSGGVNIDGYYRDITHVVIDGYRGVMGAHDGIDVFSQPNGRVSDVTIRDTLLDGQNFPATSTSHGDGIQGRGVHGLKVLNTVIDLGPNQPQKNAALYLELAGYGLDDILIQDVWLNGGGYTFYTAAVTNALAQRVRIGPTHRYSTIERTRTKGWTFDDVTGPDGTPITAP